MKEITAYYHLPSNAYWSCNDHYNGLSNKDKQRIELNKAGQCITLHPISDIIRFK